MAENKTLDLIRNAKPGSMIDIRTVDGQVDSFPVDELQRLFVKLALDPLLGEPADTIPAGTSLADLFPDGITVPFSVKL